MSEQNEQNTVSARPPSRAHRWIKLGFLLAAVIVMALIYKVQLRDPQLSGWGSDLARAMEVASRENTNVVVVFTRRPMTHADRQLVTRTLTHSRSVDAMISLGYQRVRLTAADHDDLFEKYEVKELPTLLMLDPAGQVVKRREGFINDITFVNDFLGVVSL